MKIAHKLVLALALPLALIWGLGFYAAWVSEKGLRKSIEQTSATRTHAIMDEIDRLIHTRISQWKAYVRTPLVQRTLQASNRQFEQLKDRRQYIEKQDLAWRAAPKEAPTPLIENLSHNELAIAMRIQLEALEQESGFPVFGEVFVTNRYGANVAVTNRTTDYRQDDEDWWQLAKHDALYVGDVKFDQSANVFSTTMCLRIGDDDGVFLGVLKAVLNTEEVNRVVGRRARDPKADKVDDLILFTADKRIIHVGKKPHEHSGLSSGLKLSDGSRYFYGVAFPSKARIVTARRVDQVDDHRHLSAYVFSEGFAAFEGLCWILLLEYQTKDIFNPIHRMRFNVLAFGLGATLFVLFFGGRMAWSLSANTTCLAKAIAELAEGDLDVRVEIAGENELADLGSRLNAMAAALQLNTQERHEQAQHIEESNKLLDREIDEREQLAHELLKLSAAVQQSPVMIVITDIKGTIQYVNSKFIEITGYTAEEAIGQNPLS